MAHRTGVYHRYNHHLSHFGKDWDTWILHGLYGNTWETVANTSNIDLFLKQIQDSLPVASSVSQSLIIIMSFGNGSTLGHEIKP